MNDCFKYEELTTEEKQELERIYSELNEGEILLGEIIKIKMDYKVCRGNKVQFFESNGFKWPLLVPNMEERTIVIDVTSEIFEKEITKYLEKILKYGENKNV